MLPIALRDPSFAPRLALTLLKREYTAPGAIESKPLPARGNDAYLETIFCPSDAFARLGIGVRNYGAT